MTMWIISYGFVITWRNNFELRVLFLVFLIIPMIIELFTNFFYPERDVVRFSCPCNYTLSYASAVLGLRSLSEFPLYSSLSCIVLFFSSLFVLYINIMYYFLCTDLLCKFCKL